ncbi:MAG: lipoate--protein ligase [Lachnospiraceae bacterium]|nr:lipoate--protein ligase [Lachnospiraceae bacterium]
MFYLETGSTDPYYNLAFEEVVLLRRTKGDYFILWQNDNTIVVGLNQNTEAEINSAFVAAHDIRVIRRSTGGGAVYHDLGNLNYSFLTDVKDAGERHATAFTEPVVAALRNLGLAAEASGRNDILVEGKKVSGTAQRMVKERILHHGTLLFDSDASLVEGALRADPAKLSGKGVKSVRRRIGNIRDFLRAAGKDMELTDFWRYLIDFMQERSGLVRESLGAEELAEVENLRQIKYNTWEWNFGRSPVATMTRSRRFDGGSMEIRAQIEKGIVRDIRFYGDFLSLRPLTELEEALKGIRFTAEEVSAVMEHFAPGEMFGGITKEEVQALLFSSPEDTG